MPPVPAEKGKLGAGNSFDFQRKQGEFTLESDAAPAAGWREAGGSFHFANARAGVKSWYERANQNAFRRGVAGRFSDGLQTGKSPNQRSYHET
jgi:hypothetical protein